MEQKVRCKWCVGDPLYEKYHDEEWGVPVYDDAILFEFLVLETFQAGLSWITILRKRENFRIAFDYFNYKKIAVYSEDKIQELLQAPGSSATDLRSVRPFQTQQHFRKSNRNLGVSASTSGSLQTTNPLTTIQKPHPISKPPHRFQMKSAKI